MDQSFVTFNFVKVKSITAAWKMPLHWWPPETWWVVISRLRALEYWNVDGCLSNKLLWKFICYIMFIGNRNIAYTLLLWLSGWRFRCQSCPHIRITCATYMYMYVEPTQWQLLGSITDTCACWFHLRKPTDIEVYVSRKVRGWGFKSVIRCQIH